MRNATVSLSAALLALAEFTQNPDPDAELAALVEQAEGDLTGLADAELSELRSTLAEVYAAARPEAQTAEDVERLSRLAAAISAIDADGERRVAEAAEREAALAALDAQVLANGEGDNAGDASGEADSEGDEGDEDGDEDAEGDEGDEDRQTASATGAPAPRSMVSLTGLGAFRSNAASNPAAADTGNGLSRLTAGAALINTDPSASRGYLSLASLGRGIDKVRAAVATRNPNPEAKHYIGTLATRAGRGERIVAASDFTEGTNVERSEAAINEATSRALAQRQELAKGRQNQDQRLVASGGLCAVAEPDYTLTILGGASGASFVQTLPSIASDRPLEYFPFIEVDLFDAVARSATLGGVDVFDAIGHVTAAQDAAGYVSQDGPTPDKTCVHVQCIGTKTCTLEATFACFTMGNFQARSFPELVEVFDRYTRLVFDFERDRKSQAKILADTNAKIVEGDSVFGAAVDVLGRIRYLAATIRNNRGDQNLPIDVYLPEFAGQILAQDIASQVFNNLGLAVTATQALGVLGAVENIHVMTYSADWGTTSDGSPTYLPKQAAGAIGGWPTQIRIGIWPTGTVFHQQGWDLSFGLRETLMGTNDFGTFYELAETTCTRGSDIYFLDQGICVNGARGAAVAVTCAVEEVETPPEGDETPPEGDDDPPIGGGE